MKYQNSRFNNFQQFTRVIFNLERNLVRTQLKKKKKKKLKSLKQKNILTVGSFVEKKKN